MSDLGQPVATYTYVDENGLPVMRVLRYEPKAFLQERPDGQGGWESGGAERNDRVPYRLPELIQAIERGRTVYIVEGEKDVHSLEAIGQVATTFVNGAGKWLPGYGRYFEGARVVIIADNDEPGLAHARTVEKHLQSVAESVVIRVPREGKDITDHLDLGLGLEDLEQSPTVLPWRFADGIEPGRVDSVWDGRLVLRELNLVMGEEGVGKGVLQAKVVAAITQGLLTGAPERVALVSTEDDPHTVVVPRLMAAGADLSRVAMLTTEGLQLPTDIPDLAKDLPSQGITWLWLDPINAHFAVGYDTNKVQDVNYVLHELMLMAKESGVTVVGNIHANRNPMAMTNREKLANSIAFRYFARNLIVMERAPGGLRRIVHDKHNYTSKAPDMCATLVGVKVHTNDGEVEVPLLEWEIPQEPIDEATEALRLARLLTALKATVAEEEE